MTIRASFSVFLILVHAPSMSSGDVIRSETQPSTRHKPGSKPPKPPEVIGEIAPSPGAPCEADYLVPAPGDPEHFGQRGQINNDDDKDDLPLDGFFALHPRLAGIAPLWREKQLLVVHAAQTSGPWFLINARQD